MKIFLSYFKKDFKKHDGKPDFKGKRFEKRGDKREKNDFKGREDRQKRREERKKMFKK